MKLYIDDIRTPPNDSWQICRTIGSAIAALDMFASEITDISLDHDISHQIEMGGMSRPYPCEETFDTVARYIVLVRRVLGPSFSPEITIHTSNPVGAQRMVDRLNEAGLFPKVTLLHPANRLETIL